jgi:hypothetical protein
MTWYQNLLNFIAETLLAEFIVVVLGVLFAQFIQKYLDNKRFGNWKVILLKDGQEELNKNISPGKAKAILNVPEDMGVFLKGIISPFQWINCDLMDEGPELGLLTVDRKARRIIIDLDKDHPVGGSQSPGFAPTGE